MFQFRRFPSYSYLIHCMIPSRVGFPIRKSPDRSSFAAPRSLSQLVTSFIGSWCQGIPLALLLAWPRRNQLRNFPHLLFTNAPLLRCFSSQIKTRLRWAFDLFFETMYKASLCWFQSQLTVDCPFLVLYSWIMQAHLFKKFSLAKIVFYPLKNFYPLLLPSHNCIIISFNVQFSRCILSSLETQWSHSFK